MPYTPQGLRELMASNQGARSSLPEELSKLKLAIMRGGSSAADAIRRIPNLQSMYKSAVSPEININSMPDMGINDYPPSSSGTSVAQAMPAELPEGGGMSSPRGGPVILGPTDLENNGEEIVPIAREMTPWINRDVNYEVGGGDNPARDEADAYSKNETAPTSGKEALANQYSDIEQLLGKYTDKSQDEDKFTDFLKLTLARAAMSKDTNYLAALSQGAGQATIDQIGEKDKREKNRLQAIDKLLEARRYAGDEDYKRQEMAIRKPLYEAQAAYYNDRGEALQNKVDKPTKVPIGFDGAANKAIKESYGEKYDDLDPALKQTLKSTAADVWKEAKGNLSPSQAMDEAISRLGADPDSLEEDGKWNPFKTNKLKLPGQGIPPKEAIEAEIMRRRQLATGAQ